MGSRTATGQQDGQQNTRTCHDQVNRTPAADLCAFKPTIDAYVVFKSSFRFANSLPINDPLQTVYQLMSGRMPAAATVSESCVCVFIG